MRSGNRVHDFSQWLWGVVTGAHQTKIDPYVRAVLQAHGYSKTAKTKCITTYNMEAAWTEEHNNVLTFQIPKKLLITEKTFRLRLECFDQELGRDNLLGLASHEVPTLVLGSSKDLEWMLKDALGERSGCLTFTVSLSSAEPIHDFRGLNCKRNQELRPAREPVSEDAAAKYLHPNKTPPDTSRESRSSLRSLRGEHLGEQRSSHSPENSQSEDDVSLAPSPQKDELRSVPLESTDESFSEEERGNSITGKGPNNNNPPALAPASPPEGGGHIHGPLLFHRTPDQLAQAHVPEPSNNPPDPTNPINPNVHGFKGVQIPISIEVRQNMEQRASHVWGIEHKEHTIEPHNRATTTSDRTPDEVNLDMEGSSSGRSQTDVQTAAAAIPRVANECWNDSPHMTTPSKSTASGIRSWGMSQFMGSSDLQATTNAKDMVNLHVEMKTARNLKDISEEKHVDPGFVRIAISVIVSYFLVGIIFYKEVEDWSVIDCIYFAVVTLTTCGYGDLFPTREGSRLFTCFFAFAGIAIITSCLGVLGGYVMEKQQRKMLEHLAVIQLDRADKQAVSRAHSTDKNAKSTWISHKLNKQSERHAAEGERDKKGMEGNVGRDKSSSQNNNNNNGGERSAGAGVNEHLPSKEGDRPPKLKDMPMPDGLDGPDRVHIVYTVMLYVILILVTLTIGSIYYKLEEELTVVNAIYLSCISLATVGYGDYYPLSQQGRLFTTFWLLMGTVLMGRAIAGALGFVLDERRRKQMRENWNFGNNGAHLRALDENGDGTLTQAEFVGRMLIKLKKIEDEDYNQIMTLFDSLDKDGSGSLTEEDLAAAPVANAVAIAADHYNGRRSATPTEKEQDNDTKEDKTSTGET